MDTGVPSCRKGLAATILPLVTLVCWLVSAYNTKPVRQQSDRKAHIQRAHPRRTKRHTVQGHGHGGSKT